MAELPINPKHNVFKKYRQVNYINPYSFAPATTLLTDLIAAYKFSSNANDSYTNALNGTASAISYATGVDGNCAVFAGPGLGSQINLGTSSLLSFTNNTIDYAFSFSGWLKSMSADGHVLGKSRNASSTDQEYEIQIYAGVFYFRLFDGTTAGNFIGFYITNPFSGSTFKHFAITYDGSKNRSGIKFYVDGVLQTTTGWGGTSYNGMKISTIPFYLGRMNAGNPIPMTLDEFYIWKKELTSTEVTQLQTTYYPF